MKLKALLKELPYQWPVAALLACAMLIWAIAKQERSKPAEEHFQSFIMQMERGEYGEAMAEIENAVRLSPDNAYYVAGLGLLHERIMQSYFEPEAYIANRLDLSEEERKHAEAAASSYERAISLNPNDGSFHHNLGWLYSFMGDRENAFARFKRATELDAINIPYRLSLGFLYEQSGLKEEAAREYALAIRLSPGVLDSRFFSDLLKRLPSEAEAATAAAVDYIEPRARQSDDPVFKAKLGKLYLHINRPEAIEMLKQVTLELPNLSRPWFYLGQIHEIQGDDDAAKYYYDRAAFLDRRDYLSLLQLGKFYDRHKKSQDAINHYRSAIDNWLAKGTVSARRASRVYLTDHVVADDIIPGGFLSYTEPDFDLTGTCLRLSELYRVAGDAEMAAHYERMSKRSFFNPAVE